MPSAKQNTVRKKSAKASLEDLAQSLDKFIILLEEQNEDEAVKELTKIKNFLIHATETDKELKSNLEKILDAFTGDHELESYTLRRESQSGQWSAAEELYLASTKVFTLTNRILKGY